MSNSRRGCQTCRNRRIKCDGAKPICQRCVKSKRICFERSSVKQRDFSFHLENTYAAGQAKRPRGPRSSLTHHCPKTDLQSRAVAYFLNYYLSGLETLPTISACMSECLVAWVVSRRDSVMVDLAISCLALSVFSRTQRHPTAANHACVKYGRLLKIAQNDISQSRILKANDSDVDECLLTISLMAWYETVMHQPANAGTKTSVGSLHSWSHHDGAEAILKAWLDNQIDNPPSAIIKHSRRALIRSALFRNQSLPDWIRDGTRFGEHGLDLNFNDILLRLVNLRHDFLRLAREKALQIAEIERLNQQARDLSQASRDWATQISDTCSYKSHHLERLESRSSTDFYSPLAYTYAQPGYASVWVQYFAAQILINSTRLKLLEYVPSQFLDVDAPYQTERVECIAHLREMAFGLAATVPFSLGRIKVENSGSSASKPIIITNVDEEIRPAFALLIVWPLSMASSLDDVESGQQVWFQKQLLRIGQVLGDGALECAGTENWTHDMNLAV